MGRGEINARLGHGRAPGLRVAGRERLRRAPVGRGLGPRHVHAPPRRAARPEPRALGRRHLHPAAERRRQARRRSSSSTRCCRKKRCSASSTATRRAEPNTLVDLGSAVRRLRQRRAGRDRPVHRLGRSEVGPRQRPHADAAARLRRPGPGALSARLERFMQLCGRQQHAGRAADHGRARSSTCCAARWCACSASRWSS